ncbi:acyl-CoA N-acyltransferase [Pyronema omphalodes]|nr:acyl-CoA N-acyltransferase [Pyronema omphalodes]
MASTSSSPESTPQIPNPPFHLRPARLSDISQITSIAVSAYLNGGLTLYRCPLAHTYLPDYTHSFHLRLLFRLLNPRTITLVAYTNLIDPPDLFPPNSSGYKGPLSASDTETKTTEHIIGCLQYSIPASKPTPINPHPFFPRIYYTLYHRISSYFFHDRSLHPVRAPYFVSAGHPAAPYIGEENYYVRTLAVSPAWRRRGVGKELMMGLLETAGGEGREIWLEASSAGERLYAALGFRIEKRFGEEFDIGEEGGGVMGWRPAGGGGGRY